MECLGAAHGSGWLAGVGRRLARAPRALWAQTCRRMGDGGGVVQLEARPKASAPLRPPWRTPPPAARAPVLQGGRERERAWITGGYTRVWGVGHGERRVNGDAGIRRVLVLAWPRRDGRALLTPSDVAPVALCPRFVGRRVRQGRP
jgi:hypothetical protein